jgi:hypothetical protein
MDVDIFEKRIEKKRGKAKKSEGKKEKRGHTWTTIGRRRASTIVGAVRQRRRRPRGRRAGVTQQRGGSAQRRTSGASRSRRPGTRTAAYRRSLPSSARSSWSLGRLRRWSSSLGGGCQSVRTGCAARRGLLAGAGLGRARVDG